ncbi:MAG: acylphosphatase [Calditrichaceae bacterium]
MKIAMRVFVKGRVQGIGYRWFARENADELNVTGYVRNLPNGEVEVFVEGEQAKIIDYLSRLRKGPSMAVVTDLEINQYPYENRFKKFKVEL